MNFFSAIGSPRGSALANQRTNATALPTPRENVSATFYGNRVVAMALPFQTPRAAPVRSFCSARLLNANNQRLFVWRRETNNMWTNIALNSTPANPVLTAEPDEIARKLTTILSQCPDVASVNLLNEAGNTITAEDVSNMEFTPLEESATADAAGSTASDQDTVSSLAQLMRDVYSKCEDVAIAQKRDIVQFKEEVNMKLNYIIDVIEGKARENDPASRRPVVAQSAEDVRIPLDVTGEDIEEVDEEDLPLAAGAAGSSAAGARTSRGRAVRPRRV